MTKPDHRQEYYASATIMLLAIAALTTYYHAPPEPWQTICGFFYGGIIGLTTAQLLHNLLTIYTMKLMANNGMLMKHLGRSDQEVAEYMGTPSRIKTRRRADEIVSLYANGGHLHPAVDLLFYAFNLILLIALSAPIPFVMVAVCCLVDFKLRVRADEVNSLMTTRTAPRRS